MMRVRELVRDVVLVAAAAAVGWWCHGAGTPVHAERASSSNSARGDDSGVAFQIIGEGAGTGLALYSPGNHVLYVYPRVGTGNSHISCEYSFRINRPGGAIDRENCPVGEQLP
jgi:hypothetical protein